MRKRLLIAAAILLASLIPQTRSLAQTAPQPAIQVPLQDLPANSVFGERMGRWFGALRDGLGFGPSAINLAQRYSRDSVQTDDFNWLMGIAGFKLKMIESTFSLLPGLTLEFGQARQLSEADHEFLERQLERHAQRNPGPLAAVQRIIMEGIIEANGMDGYAVEKISVTLLPLPYVRLTIAPVDAPMGPDASRIMRAIEQLNYRLQQTNGPRTGGNQLDMPPPPMLRRAVDSL
jgi:hypothetical protein